MCCSSDPIFGPHADPKKDNIIYVYNKYDFKIDPQNGSTQTHVTPTICCDQVRTSWQWHRAIQKNVKADGADILRINLDETSMPLNYDSQKGVVTTAFQKEVVLVDKQSAKRGSLTHVVMICDDTAIQPLLPQMIIGGERLLRVQDLRALENEVPKNVLLVRAKSSWITVEALVILLQRLRKVLTDNKIVKIPILLMDGCPVHIHPQVWRAARRLKIMLCFVPTALTWLLQPLDVKAIRMLKACARGLYRLKQIETRKACVEVTDVIRVQMVAIRKILQGNAWSSLFNSCGYTDTSHVWTTQIQAMFDRVENVPMTVPDEPPNTEELLHILPKKKTYAMDALLWKMPVMQAPFKFTLARIPMPRPKAGETYVGFPHTSHTAFRPVTGTSAGGGSSTDPIALRTRSRSNHSIETVPPHSTSASHGIPTEPCPSSTSAHPARETVDAHHQQRWRPQAMSQPKKKTRISSGTRSKI